MCVTLTEVGVAFVDFRTDDIFLLSGKEGANLDALLHKGGSPEMRELLLVSGNKQLCLCSKL